MDTVTITNEMVVDAGTKNCGYTKRQLAVFGISWPPRKGWKRMIVGRSVPVDQWQRFSGKPDSRSLEDVEAENRQLRSVVADLEDRLAAISQLTKPWSQQ